MRDLRGGKPACLLFAILALLPVAVDAQSSGTRGELWPEVDLYLNLNEHSRFFFKYASTLENHPIDYADRQVGGYFDYYLLPLVRRRLREIPDASRDKFLRFRIGYLYQWTPPDVKPSIQHIPTLETEGRSPPFWGMHLRDRNRFEFRIVNGVYEPRYRNRLRLERTFRAGRFALTPYAEAEAFYTWKYDAFNQIRYTPGMEWTVAHFLVLEGYYTRQRDTRSSPEYVNALGVTVQFHVRREQ